MEFKTNDELWEYQSSFLNDHSVLIIDPMGQEHWRCNIGAAFFYLAKHAMPPREYVSAKKETEYLRRLFGQMRRVKAVYYYGYHVTVTDKPYPRILGKKNEDEQKYVLIKRLDDIPILCKADLEDSAPEASISALMEQHEAKPIIQRTVEDKGLTYWGSVIVKDDPHLMITRKNNNQILEKGARAFFGDVIVTGGIDAGSGAVEEFDYPTFKKDWRKSLFYDELDIYSDDVSHIIYQRPIRPRNLDGDAMMTITIGMFDDDISGAYNRDHNFPHPGHVWWDETY